MAPNGAHPHDDPMLAMKSAVNRRGPG